MDTLTLFQSSTQPNINCNFLTLFLSTHKREGGQKVHQITFPEEWKYRGLIESSLLFIELPNRACSLKLHAGRPRSVNIVIVSAENTHLKFKFSVKLGEHIQDIRLLRGAFLQSNFTTQELTPSNNTLVVTTTSEISHGDRSEFANIQKPSPLHDLKAGATSTHRISMPKSGSASSHKPQNAMYSPDSASPGPKRTNPFSDQQQMLTGASAMTDRHSPMSQSHQSTDKKKNNDSIFMNRFKNIKSSLVKRSKPNHSETTTKGKSISTLQSHRAGDVEKWTLTIITLVPLNGQFYLQVLPSSTAEALSAMIKNKLDSQWTNVGIKMLFKQRALDLKLKLKDIQGMTNNERIYVVTDIALPELTSAITVPSSPSQTVVEVTRRQFQNMGTVQQNRNNRQIAQPNNRQIVQPYNAQNRPNRAHARLNNCSILHRNIDACVTASSASSDPSGRTRYNDPAQTTAAEPSAIDFGNHVFKLAATVRDWALELNRLSDVLVRDPEFSGPEHREKVRRLIQNNMDTARYFHPYLQNFTSFNIPLISDRPRRLIVQNDNQP